MTVQKCIDTALQILGKYSEGGTVISRDDPRYLDISDSLIWGINVARCTTVSRLGNDELIENYRLISDESDELGIPESACAQIPFFAAACAAVTLDLAVYDRLVEIYESLLNTLPHSRTYKAVKNSLFR